MPAMMKLVLVKNMQEVKVGDFVETFRGERVQVAYIWQPGTSQGGRGGRIQTEDGDLYFPNVIDAEWAPS